MLVVKENHVFAFKMDKKWKLMITGLIVAFLIYRMPLQGEIPDDMIEKAKEIDKMSKDKLELARNVYSLVDNKFTSPLREYLRQVDKVFLKNRGKIWSLENEYIPSNTQNEIFKELLLLTGRFKEEDFEYTQSICEISPHEYWKLNIDGKTIFIDLWMADNSILNDTFGCYSPRPCNFEQYSCAEGFP